VAHRLRRITDEDSSRAAACGLLTPQADRSVYGYERKPPGPSPVPIHEPEEPEPDVINPGSYVAGLSMEGKAKPPHKGGKQSMTRDIKLPKGAKKLVGTPKNKNEDRLLSKLQEESLKVHGDPLDRKKVRAEMEK
jgi:hypothetical protein